MGRFRGWLGKLERTASEDLRSFVLRDGSRFFYDPVQTHAELYLHGYDCLLGDAEKWPEPPQILQMLCRAEDPAAVLERFKPENPERAFIKLGDAYDMDALVNERRLVRIFHPPVEDLSTAE